MPNTQILKNKPKLIEHLLGFLNRKTPLKLCHRGLHSETFHKQCDDKAGTVVLVRVPGDYIFGGYTDQTWQGNYKGLFKRMQHCWTNIIHHFSNSALCCINLSYFKVKVLNNNRLPWNVKQYAKEALH